MNNLTILNGLLFVFLGFFSTPFSSSDSISATSAEKELTSTTYTEVPTTAAQATPTEGKKEIMTKKITEMYRRYGQHRTEASEIYESQGWDKLRIVDNQRLIESGDKMNLREAKTLFEDYGLPSISKVGEDMAHKYWLIVLQCNNDVVFQTHVLKEMHQSMEENDVSTADYATLTDRIRINQGRQQLYGTQLRFNRNSDKYEPYDLKKPETVDQRRIIMGLEQMKTYINKVNLKFKKPVRRNIPTRRSDDRRKV